MHFFMRDIAWIGHRQLLGGFCPRLGTSRRSVQVTGVSRGRSRMKEGAPHPYTPRRLGSKIANFVWGQRRGGRAISRSYLRQQRPVSWMTSQWSSVS